MNLLIGRVLRLKLLAALLGCLGRRLVGGLVMPSARPFIWALLPATARPRVSAASSSKPRRSATTVAHSVSTGARFTRIACSPVMKVELEQRCPAFKLTAAPMPDAGH